jgi:small subunit ribosomal protein S19e
MVNALEVDPNELIERAAKLLEEGKLVEPPEWSGYVKTGMHKERPPVNRNWWYVRAAAVLRSTYKLGPIGTSKLRTKYGGRKNRGVKPEHHYRGSGAVIRKALQQLEKSGLVVNQEKGVHKGRNISNKGKSMLDKIAAQMIKENSKITNQ